MNIAVNDVSMTPCQHPQIHVQESENDDVELLKCQFTAIPDFYLT